jgi:hypothetical protein
MTKELQTMRCDKCKTMHEFDKGSSASCSCGGFYQTINLEMLFFKMLEIQEKQNEILTKLIVEGNGKHD